MAKEKIIGKKFYATTNEKATYLSWEDTDIEKVKEHIDKDRPYLLELTVTKVYTKNPIIIELKEEENA